MLMHPRGIAAPLLLLALLLFSAPAAAYHNGGDDTNCWLGSGDVNLVEPCTMAKITFTERPAHHNNGGGEALFTNQPFNITAVLTVNATVTLARTPSTSLGHLIPHANIHMCKVELGWCTPNVRDQPNLSTQSPEIKSDSLVLHVPDLRLAIAGHWTIVAHFTFFTTAGKEWNVAAAFKQHIKAEIVQERAADWAVVLCKVLTWVGIIVSIAFFIAVAANRNHWVFKSSTPSMSMLMCVGCFVGFFAVFTLLVPGVEEDTTAATSGPADDDRFSSSSLTCNARIWLLALAFDLVLVPFGLRTWRVYELFASSRTGGGGGGGFRRVIITDTALIKIGAALLALDGAFCLVWTAAWPLHLARVPFQSNPDVVYSMQCVGENQLALEIVAYVLHALPLVWLARAGNHVRRSFQHRATQHHVRSSTSFNASANIDQAKLEHFNESEAISQTLLSLGCVSVFAIALQYTVRDSPTSVLLMVAGGVLWSAYFTLAVNFVPRFIKVYFYENDGVTKRDTATDVELARNTAANNTGAPAAAAAPEPGGAVQGSTPPKEIEV